MLFAVLRVGKVNVLIGHTGFIGKFLIQKLPSTIGVNSTTMNQISGQSFEILYCCAPGGNRLFANQNPDFDYKNVMQLISSIKSINTQRVVLISTVDTQHSPDTVYGSNRLILEQFVKTLPCYNIVRLCTLIDPDINKNVLHDLKNQKFLESVNLEQILQWYRLRDLPQHLNLIIRRDLKEINLVSEPISTQEIVEKFFNCLSLNLHKPVKKYDLTCDSPELSTSGYVYTKNEIFGFMKDYFNV